MTSPYGNYIKTHDSESRGQEDTGPTRRMSEVALL